MRARNLKPGFFKNEILGSADPLYGLLFQGLWLMADREGRLLDIPRRISAELFPYRKRVRESLVDKILDWLHRQRFIERYEVNGRRYIQVIEFLQHQNPHKNESPSKIPPLSSVSHQSHSSNGLKSAPESAPDDSDAEAQPRHDVRPASSLIPSSLNHESLFTDSPSIGNGHAAGQAEGAENKRPTNRNKSELSSGPVEKLPPLTLEQCQQLQSAYPAGIYRQSEWLVAQKLINQHLANGVSFDRILASFQRYADQCRAKRNTGTEYVLSPVKHCDMARPQFDEPFPLPRTKAENCQDANVDAGRAWLAQQEAKDAIQ